MSRAVLLMMLLGVAGCGRPSPVEEAAGEQTPRVEEPAQAIGPVARPPSLEVPAPPLVQAGELFVSRFQPHQGAVGTTVRMVGSGFSRVLEENRVFFGGPRCGVQATVVAANEGFLEFTVPEGARTSELSVSVGARTVFAGPFTVLTRPQAWGVEPRTALVSTRDHVITITGDGFVAPVEVTLEGVVLSSTVVSFGQVQAVVPYSLKTTAGVKALQVVGADGALELTVENPGPAISAVLPAVLHSRVDRVTVSGAGFVERSVVLIDNAPVPTTWDQGSLVAEVPALVPGPHQVAVQTPSPGGGVSAPVTITVQ